MKDRLILTISDVNGSKQYTVSQFLKMIFFWIIIAVVILFIIGFFVVKYLSHNVEVLEKDKKELNLQRELLVQQIIKNQETLQAMDEQLKEAKKLIGLDEEIKKDDTLQQDISKPELSKSRTLTKLEYTFLTRLIPNGKPLEYRRISTRYGMRIHPKTKRKQFHSALDLAADIGTPIKAPADGVVVYAGKKKFYGNFLLISHGLGFATAYGHLHRIGVKTGDYVKKGEVVALCGNTGRSTGPHLHYELRYLSKWLDPEPFIKRWSYETYKDVMQKTPQVNWDSMIKKVRERIELIKLKNSLENKGE